MPSDPNVLIMRLYYTELLFHLAFHCIFISASFILLYLFIEGTFSPMTFAQQADKLL